MEEECIGQEGLEQERIEQERIEELNARISVLHASFNNLQVQDQSKEESERQHMYSLIHQRLQWELSENMLRKGVRGTKQDRMK